MPTPVGGGVEDVDGDGNIDSFTYIGCFEISGAEVFNFDEFNLPDDDMTPTVSKCQAWVTPSVES